MKRVGIVDLGSDRETFELELAGARVEVSRHGCHGDPETARSLVSDLDGVVDAIGLDGLPVQLEIGHAHVTHRIGRYVADAAKRTPIVDGSGVRSALERWSVVLADRAEPGIFSEKRVLMVPGLNHVGLTQALSRHTSHVRYADPEIFFGVPELPGVGSARTLGSAERGTLELLREAPFERLAPPINGGGQPAAAGDRLVQRRSLRAFAWADLLAGDVAAIRRLAPPNLAHKIVVVPYAAAEDLEDLRQRGVSIVVTLMPSLAPGDSPARHSAALIEAAFVALASDGSGPLSEDSYLNLMAQTEWSPHVSYLQPEQAGINRFAFVIHPLHVGFIHNDRRFRWTRYLPNALVEATAAFMPPIYVSRVRGGRSPATGQRIEGYMVSLCATPREMMRHGERFTYKRLNQAARMAERQGCRLMGLGAFTSVVGDAGVTVAHEADIAVTSGNSLTVAATLEAAKQGVVKMGKTDLTTGRAMVIGATGSIGSVCARLLAQAIHDVVLVSIEPEKLVDLKRTIESETPGARVTIGTRAEGLAQDCDLIVTATSAFGQRILDISQCKPGAVVCDVARPPDIGKAEAALRPDLLVVESGEVLIPGEIDFGYDIGLPEGVAYACLAETALLAMEGRFENFTLGRQIEMEQVKEIYRLFRKHGFEIAGLRSFGHELSDEDFAAKRAAAERLRADPKALEAGRVEVAARLAEIPVAAKGVGSGSGTTAGWAAAAGGVALAAWWLRRRSRRGRSEPSVS